MKKIVLALLLVMGVAGSAYGAGTVAITTTNFGPESPSKYYTVTYTWTADASDGSVPATAAQFPYGGYIVRVVTNPGTNAPSDNYDLTLTDADGVDVVGGALANRDTSNTESVVPIVDSVNSIYGGSLVAGSITMNLTNNSVNSAGGTLVIYVERR